MNRLKKKYQEEILPKLKEEFKFTNNLMVPKVIKVMINVGVGDAKDNQAALERIVKDIASLAGQKPVVNKAKKSISTFKLSQGQPVGVSATLRGERMYQFLDKLMGVVLPKVRDFRGLSPLAFDNSGNYTLGLREQTIFPEVSGQGMDKIRGLEITVVTRTRDKEKGKRLLELLGMPFKKGDR